MSNRKLVDGMSVSIKDETGAYVPSTSAPKEQIKTDISIDDLMNAGLQNIRKAMSEVTKELGLGSPSREVIQNLKDLMGLLRDLKKDEKDIINSMTDEQLQRLLEK